MPDNPTRRPDPLAAIEHPELRQAVEQLRTQNRLAVFKAIAHAADPQRYPLARGQGAVEDHVLRVVDALGRSKKRGPVGAQNAKARVLQVLQNPASDVSRLAAQHRVSFSAAPPVHAQLRAVGVLAPRLAPAAARSIELAQGKLTRKTSGPRPVLVQGEAIAQVSVVHATIASSVAHAVASQSSLEGNLAISQKHAQLGGDQGALGAAAGSFEVLPDRQGKKREFARGSIYWSPRTGAHALLNPHRAKWLELGGVTSPLGYPAGDVVRDEGTDRQPFERGEIHKNDFGVHAIYGRIHTELLALPKRGISLGRLKTSVTVTGDHQAKYVHFELGAIYERLNAVHTIDRGLWELWKKNDLERGPLGHLKGSLRVTAHPLRPSDYSERSIDCDNGTIFQWNHEFFESMWGGQQGREVEWIDRRLLPAWQAQRGILGSLRFPIEPPHRRGAELVQAFEGGEIALPDGQSAPVVRRPMSRVELRLKRIYCYDETNPESPGDDEIGVGVVWLDPAGNTGRQNFGEQATGMTEKKDRYFDLVLHAFDLTALPAWPQTCQMVVSFYESDGGGINDTLADIMNTVRDQVASLVEGIVEAAVYGAVGDVVVILGTSVGSLFAGAVGALAAMLVVAVFDAIIGAITEAFADDAFPARIFEAMALDARQLIVNGESGPPRVVPISYSQNAVGGGYTFGLEWRTA